MRFFFTTLPPTFLFATLDSTPPHKSQENVAKPSLVLDYQTLAHAITVEKIMLNYSVTAMTQD